MKMARVMLGMLLLTAGCSRQTAQDATKAQQAGNAEKIQQAEEEGRLTPAEKSAKAAAGKSNDNAPYYTDLPLSEFMPHVMQYAGDGIWSRQGYVTDKDGTRSLFPKNDKEWEAAESGARTLAEVTNVLLIPGRRVPDPDWDKAVLTVRRVALKAAEAAEKKNEDAFFAAGSELDEACDACHVKFDPKFKPQAPVK